MSNSQTNIDGLCGKEAAFRFTWPGREESFICAEHASKLDAIARAMGLPLQIIPLDRTVERDQKTCRQCAPSRSMPCD